MGWVSLVMLIIQALIKLPDLIDSIKKWLEIFKNRVPKAHAFRERGVFGKALKQALDNHEARTQALAAGATVALTGSCPVKSCVEALELAYPGS